MKRDSEFRYMKLANILREQILSGYIRPGEYLLSENDLSRYYDISRTSVRKSLEQLASEGLIIKKVGQGTIVNPELKITPTQNKVLRIFAPSPSHFFEMCMPAIIERFRRDFPHVDVKVLTFSLGEFWNSVHASREAGITPDILFVTDRLYGELEEKEGFLDLAKPLDEVSRSVYPRLRDAFSQNGCLRALPVTLSAVFLAYNPERFRACGVPEPGKQWTQDEFLAAAERLTTDENGDGIADRYGLTLSPSFTRWPVIALQNGVDFKNPDRAAILRALTFIHDLLFRRRAAVLSPRYSLNVESFKRGKSAMVLTTSIELAGWSGGPIPFRPRVASLPFGDRQSTMLIANAFMIPEHCSDPELAARFLKLAASPEIQERFCRAMGFNSVLP